MKLGVDVVEAFPNGNLFLNRRYRIGAAVLYLSGIEARSPLHPVNKHILLMSGTKAAADHLRS